MNALSKKAHISLETLHRYEHGSPAALEVAQRLERILNTKLITGINVFDSLPEFSLREQEKGESEDSAWDKLRDLGLKISVFERSPLSAAEKESGLLIGKAENEHQLPRKALLLAKTRSIVQKPGLMIARESKYTRMSRIPVVLESNLSTFSNLEDILSHIKSTNTKNYADKKTKTTRR